MRPGFLTREQREATGRTSVRVTRATAALLRELLRAREQQLAARAARRSDWWRASGRRYGDRADVTLDDVVYQLAFRWTRPAAERHAVSDVGTGMPPEGPASHAGRSAARSPSR
jgi:hypothetical protein